MNDLITSIKADLYERAASPLFGMFSISWALWNYKLIMVIFSSMEIKAKLEFISQDLYPELVASILQAGIYPAITTAVFIFIYPYPAKYVYEHTRNRQKELKEIKQKIEDETPLTIEESREIRRELIKLELEYDKELERRKDENDRLKEVIEELNNKSSELEPESLSSPEEPERKLPEVTEEQIDLLLMISKERRMKEKEVIAQAKTDSVKTEYNIGELIELGHLNDIYPTGGKALEVTHSGRRLLLSAGRI